MPLELQIIQTKRASLYTNALVMNVREDSRRLNKFVCILFADVKRDERFSR
jgi:hypothetical protein